MSRADDLSIYWRDVVGYEGLYMVSSDGEVYDLTINSPAESRLIQGYYHVCLIKGNRRKEKAVHVLMADAFFVRPKGRRHVHHKDQDRTNNHIRNLQIMSHQKHMTLHCIEHHTDGTLGKTYFKPGQADRRQRKNVQVPLDTIQKIIEMQEIDTPDTDIVKMTKLSRLAVKNIRRGKRRISMRVLVEKEPI